MEVEKNRNSIDKNYGIAEATVEDMAVFFLLAIHCYAGTLSSWFMGDEARNNRFKLQQVRFASVTKTF